MLRDGIPGLVSATAVGTVGALTLAGNSPRRADLLVPLLWLAVLATMAALAVHRLLLLRTRPPDGVAPHVLLPLPLAIVILVGVNASGRATDPVGTTVTWALVTLLAHLVLGAGWRRRGNWRQASARAALVAVVLVGLVGAGVLLGRASQPRWRAADFRAVGVPLVVPELPGYELTGTYAGRYSVRLRLEARTEFPPGGRYLLAIVERTSPTADPGPCQGRPIGQPFLERPDQDHRPALVCLPGGEAVLSLFPRPDGGRVEALLPLITVRPATAAELARYPDEDLGPEAD